MCGQCGIIFGRRERSRSEIKKLTTIFTGLLAANEHRGKYATGAANIRMDGTYEIHKAPVNATMFVISDEYERLLHNVDSKTAILMGHTRWPTQGSHLDNRNNHPIVVGEEGAGQICGTHNGHILNWKALFASLGYPRTTEVDSEIIFRMAEDSVQDGKIDRKKYTKLLAKCKGQMSAVAVLISDPESIVIIKGNKPLVLLYHYEYDVLLYASELDFMTQVLLRDGKWSHVSVKPISVVVLRCRDLHI